MKTYRGTPPAAGFGPGQAVVHDGRKTKPLGQYTYLRNASPDGFGWGYQGSGPMQLALALCADATRDNQLALQVYGAFCIQVVRELPRNEPWELTQAQIKEHVERIGGPLRDLRKRDEQERARVRENKRKATGQ